MPTMLVLGASGTMGELIAREAARRDLQLVLAGREHNRLLDLASGFRAGQASAALVDVAAPATLASVLSRVDVVVNTVGPFSRLAGPVIDACLAAGVAYVDLANELAAVLALLDLDKQAKHQSVTLVAGAGFGVVATETLALLLSRASPHPPRSMQVLGAPAVAYASSGVQLTIAEAMAGGSARYVNGLLQRGALGDGATTLDGPGGARRVIAAPVGDLVAVQRATGAPDVVAYAPVPSERPTGGLTAAEELRSYAWAAASDADGRQLQAHLTFGEGFSASAAIAVEVAARILEAPRPGAWTPGALLGIDLALACGAEIHGPEARSD